MSIEVHFGDNLPILESMSDGRVSLVYIDPPFNTGKAQKRTQFSTIRDDKGDRVGFQGKRYRSVKVGTKSYDDIFDDYLAFLEPRLVEARRILTPDGSIFFHIDYRKDILGTPDIAFVGRRRLVFVHGCFWHRHPGCKNARTPKSRMEFWTRKLDDNRERDLRVQKQLQGDGWRVMVVWECETKDEQALIARLRDFMEEPQ